MRIGVTFVSLAGLVLAASLIVHAGIGAVLTAAAATGWGGFVILCLFGAALFALLGTAWFLLVPRHEKQALTTFMWGRAVRDCAGELLPFSQVGAMVIGARAVMLRGVGAPLAFASTVVDLTLETIAQIVFVMAGLAVVIIRAPRSAFSGTLVEGLATILIAASLGIALFVVLQRRAFGAIERLVAQFLPRAAAQAGAAHRTFGEIHASRLRLAGSAAIHLCSWLATALWAWIAIHLIGGHLSYPAVLVIEAIVSAVRSVVFIVPAAVGVQEAAYAVLGPLFGLAAPAALALSLLKRARDLALGIPVLLAWQVQEGGHVLKASRDAAKLIGEK